LLLFHYSTVVVDKDERVIELGVVFAIGPGIGRAQVALHGISEVIKMKCMVKCFTSGSYSGSVVLDGDSFMPLHEISV
jgi:hypothetical protein